jgi:hypothetical protein
MKTEIRKPNTKTPKLRRKTVGQKVWPRGLPRLPAPRTRGSPALPENKRNGRARKLRADARWRQFTQAEQDHIREIFEQDGQEAAAAYCRKIHKYWSGSSISRFFHGERAGDSSPDVTRHTKLRLDSGWWQFTEREQDKLRKIFERDGQMAAEKYCRNIGKPWSHTAISRCFGQRTRSQTGRERRDAPAPRAVEDAHCGLRQRRDGHHRGHRAQPVRRNCAMRSKVPRLTR